MNESVQYPKFRQRFLENSLVNQFSIINIKLAEDLYIDLSYKIFDPQFNWVVHISGNHGVEGYIGSMIQSQILEEFQFLNCGKNILFIHALNPYGMKFFRRMNFHNIDLNRNTLSDEQRSFLKKQDTFHKYIDWNRSKNLPLLLFKTFQVLLNLKRLNINWSKASQEIAQGQLIDKDSLFYCGDYLAEELQLIKFHLEQIIDDSKQVSVIDVHSGLGEYMKESLIVEYFDQSEYQFWKYQFKNSEIIIPDETKGYYKVNGGLSYLFKKQLAYKNLNYIYQEFGTKTNFDVISTLIKENYFFKTQNLQRTDHYENPYSNEMLECFFPSSEEWQNHCLKQGLLRLHQILSK